jgi:coenzyme Q-binding protein COQ10
MPTHAEKRILRYTPEQMYELVADVRRYPEFLPWCVAARVVSHVDNELLADLTIGFKMFRETFRSRVQLNRPHEVRVQYENGPFRYLNNTWKFTPSRAAPRSISLSISSFERVLQAVIGVVFNEAVRLMVRSFERRAMTLYGRNTAANPAVAPGNPATRS